MPAEDLGRVFRHGAEEMLGTDGTVDIDALYDGTFDTADTVFGDVEVRIGGELVVVEAMSMMLHDPAFLPPFADPYDAQVEIAVCTSPETVKGMALPDLRAYLGFFAWQVDGSLPLELSFPATGRADVDVEIREFVDFQPLLARVVSVTDGGALSLAAVEALGGSSRTLRGVAVSILVLLLCGGGYHVGRSLIQRRNPRPS